METYADSLGLSSLEGQSVRLTFCVRRVQEPKPPKPPQFKQYPVCRLVLPPSAVVDLFNQLNQLMGALHKIGLVKIEQGKPAEAIPVKGPDTKQ